MNAVILSCSTLTNYVQAAQETCGTDYPVYYLDKKDHIEPLRMQEQIRAAIDRIPEEYDTILVCMGFCGGSWQDIASTRTLVIPRVDDCVSLVMTADDHVNTYMKEPGHMYVFGGDDEGFSISAIHDQLIKENGIEDGEHIFSMMFENYRNIDIIDTGLYNCYDEAFIEKVQAEADRINADIDFVPGSNLLLEKLFSGKWDCQFYIVKPNTKITQGSFFDVDGEDQNGKA